MNKVLKKICLFVALSIVMSSLLGCSKRKEGDPPVYTSSDDVVMTLGGYNVTADFYRYLFLNTKDFFDNGDESYWEQEENDVEKIKDYVVESLRGTYGMFSLADEYNINLTDSDIDIVKGYLEEAKTGYSDEEFEKELEKSYLNEELYTFILKVQQLEYLVYAHITDEGSGIIKVDDKTLESELETNFVRATHILFTFENEDEEATQKQKAEEVLARLKNGEDFETLKEEYSDDTKLKNNTDGYYFTHGEFSNEFEYEAFGLKENEISKVIKTSVGYHIVKRLPLDKEYINENFEQLRKQCIIGKYYDLLKNTYKDLVPEYTDNYKNIKLDSFI